MVEATPGYGMWPNGYGYGRDNGCCEMGSDLSRQIAEAVYNIVQSSQTQNLSAIQATNAAAQAAQEIATETRADLRGLDGDIRLSISDAEGRIASSVANGTQTTERTRGDIQLSQSQSESRLGVSIAAAAQVAERNGGDTRLAGSQSESRLGLAVSDGNAETRRVLSDVQMQLHSTLEARSAEIRQNQARDAAAAVLEIERTRFSVVESRCHLERQAADNLARIQHEAAENKYELATKMAECCCKIEEAVHDEGCKTRGLIEKNEIDRLRDALEHARRESDHHRNNESIRLTVQQFANQSQRVYAPAPVTTTPPAA